MQALLNMWTIFAAVVSVGLGGWVCLHNVWPGAAMMVSGLVLLGLGVFLVRESDRRRHVFQPVSTPGRTAAPVRHPNPPGRPIRRRSAA